MMKRHTIWLFGCIAASTIVASGVLKFLEQKQPVVSDEHTAAEYIAEPTRAINPAVVERVISSSQLWRPVQDRVRDTVVQIFSQVAAMDLLQPFRTPQQGVGCGSGFFISEDGDLITNAHVVDQAKAVWIQIPSLGKRILDVQVVGVSPERDIALLRLSPESLEIIRKELGSVPFLPLGDSDLVRRSDDVLALGYPLGQQSLKSTTGVISGREQNLIQMSAAINPGNSGGPLVNNRGEVVGINTSGIVEAQNVGYAIPINDLKIALPDLHKIQLLRKPFLGVLFNNATEALTEYLGNPAPGGCYVVEVVKGSTLDRAGVQGGDMIYEINGYPIDIYGEMRLPFGEDKISIVDYVSRLAIGETLSLTVYRQGSRKEFSVTFGIPERPAIHEIYPGYEEVDYEIFAGMVVMPLYLNHLPMLANRAPGLAKFAETRNQNEPALVITHIFPNSQVYRSRSLPVGCTLNEINGMKVSTLEDFRAAVTKGMDAKFLTIKATDNVTRKSENLLVVLPWNKVLEEEPKLARDFRYPLTKMTHALLKNYFDGKGDVVNPLLQQPIMVANG